MGLGNTQLYHTLDEYAFVITNEKLYQITKTTKIESFIDQQFLKYTAHVTRMSNDKWQKQLLFMKSEVPYARDIWKNVGGMMGGIDGKQARKIMQDGKVFGKALDEQFGRRKQSYP